MFGRYASSKYHRPAPLCVVDIGDSDDSSDADPGVAESTVYCNVEGSQGSDGSLPGLLIHDDGSQGYHGDDAEPLIRFPLPAQQLFSQPTLVPAAWVSTPAVPLADPFNPFTAAGTVPVRAVKRPYMTTGRQPPPLMCDSDDELLSEQPEYSDHSEGSEHSRHSAQDLLDDSELSDVTSVTSVSASGTDITSTEASGSSDSSGDTETAPATHPDTRPSYHETLDGACIARYQPMGYSHAFDDQPAVCDMHPGCAIPLHVDMDGVLQQYVCCTHPHPWGDRACNVCASCNRLGDVSSPVRLVRVARCHDVQVCGDCFHTIMWHTYPLELLGSVSARS